MTKLRMEFNPGLKSYQPKLPLKKAGKKDKVKLNTKEILVLATAGIIILGLLLLIFYISK